MPRRSSTTTPQSRLDQLIRLWLLRLLVPLGGHQHFLRRHGINDDSVARVVGMAKWLAEDKDFDQKAALRDLRRLHAAGERRGELESMSGHLFEGTAALATQVGLTASECRLLEFTVAVHTDGALDTAADYFGTLTASKLFLILATVTGLPLETVKEGLASTGRLARSGLLTLDWIGTDRLRQKLKLLSARFAERLRTGESDPLELLRGMVVEASPPSLSLGDYPHLKPSIRLLLPYLRRSLAELRSGVNVLFHGAPGTGKSQLCRIVAQELGVHIFEVACAEEDGDTITGGGRLRAYRAAQCFFGGSDALLVFDEIEDVFQSTREAFSMEASASERKGWLNRAMELNAVPTFWLTNDVGSLDPAFVRRFDVVVEFPVPPRHQREKILRKACPNGLGEAHVRALAQSEHLAPAVMTRAARVVQTIREELPGEAAPAALRRLIDSTLEAQGHPALPRMGSEPLPRFYDPALLNASVDLAAVAQGLIASRSGRLCLYGPPGTGKTAFGHWLAEQMDQPLHVRRASDLLSKWVGGSEQNIAEAFRQAERDQALLLIDEVDSFLQDRQSASRSWEITQVNEMLTQMEQFPGVFIASTNLMQGLDQAALRRFDLKVQFDHLRPEQSWRLFRSHCTELDLPEVKACHKLQLGLLGELTPGDFAAVVRRHRFCPFRAPEDMLAALEEECAMKGSGKRAIGFGGEQA